MNAAEGVVNDLYIPLSIYKKMELQVAKEAPLEACGMLGGRRSGKTLQVERLYAARNQLSSPNQYQIDPVDQLQAFNQIEKSGLELVAIYHSHPAGPGYPSPLDVSRAYYPDAVQLIWFSELEKKSGMNESTSKWVCRGFFINQRQVRMINLLIGEQAPD
jgi:proteasome lid subunit RPN8/RPN11